jgi:hypothetical protein
MSYIDPIYLRLIFSGLASGQINKDNINTIPSSVVDVYDELFLQDKEVRERHQDLVNFSFLSLLNEPLDLDTLSSITTIEKTEWQSLLFHYSRFFNKSVDDKYELYHQRFLAFILHKSSSDILIRCNSQLLSALSRRERDRFYVEHIGRFFAFDLESSLLFEHINKHQEEQHAGWWTRDMLNLLDVLSYSSNVELDYNQLCELLRCTLNHKVIRKGSSIIVRNASKINWDDLHSFFDTTRFQYELAYEFALHMNDLPSDWFEIMLNEDHPVSYTFSYTWKYFMFDTNNDLDRQQICKMLEEGSPYQRIIIIMIWGQRCLQGKNDEWLEEALIKQDSWEYLTLEFKNWKMAIQQKEENSHEDEFRMLKKDLPEQYHYIFDDYWNLIHHSLYLDRDTYDIYFLPKALDVALWIYRNPVWEIGKAANNILIQRLQIKEFRAETIHWLNEKWQKEELYALGEVIFELRKYLSSEEEFFDLCLQLANSENCQIRGSFLSDLSTYLESISDMLIIQKSKVLLLPIFVKNISDIWEMQELIRLIQFYRDKNLIDDNEINQIIQQIHVFYSMKNPFDIEYNDFWRQAEKIKKTL